MICKYNDGRLLHLIFGKWNILKRKLNDWSYYNFDIIIDAEARSTALSTSVLMGGLKEYYESMCSLVGYCAKQLDELLYAGFLQLSKSERSDNKYNSLKHKSNDRSQKTQSQNIAPVSQKLIEINMLNMYLNPVKLNESTMNQLFSFFPYVG